MSMGWHEKSGISPAPTDSGAAQLIYCYRFASTRNSAAESESAIPNTLLNRTPREERFARKADFVKFFAFFFAAMLTGFRADRYLMPIAQ
jgi:hypothetical protein